MCLLATICFNEASQTTVRRARDMLNLSREHSKNPGHRFMRRENAASTWVPKCAPECNEKHVKPQRPRHILKFQLGD